ncbi:MAG TPA: type II secretion system protein [Candidatus Saccharimonadales bacterium]|nr:type II secretion system protein [Candidatus Saccharimonadales bacterium]
MARSFGYHNIAYAILDRMKGGGIARGFTIIETLMVLAISAALFVAIAAVLSGRQGRTEFSQAIQDIKNQIQQQINDVGSGLYGNTNNFSCSAGGLGPNISPIASGDQGANTGCIFLGKAMQFQVAGSNNPEQFKVFPIAGLQRDSAGDEVTSYALARPKVVAPSSSDPSVPDGTSTGRLLYNITTQDIRYGASPGTAVGAVAFVNSLASASGDLVGSQRVNVIPINSSTLNASPEAAAQTINTMLATSPINPSGGVQLCFVSGSTNQSGLIVIGGNNRELSVTLSIKENTTCS